jgi:hypothetical protein
MGLVGVQGAETARAGRRGTKPKFNVKRPEGKIDEEIVAEVKKKVVQMINNYTHKEWECA